MSSRSSRRRSPQPLPAAASADELVSRLRALLPPAAAAAPGNNDNGGKASSTAQVLEEACVYIRRLHAEVDGLADRLAQLLEDLPPSSAAGADEDDAAQLIIRALLMM